MAETTPSRRKRRKTKTAQSAADRFSVQILPNDGDVASSGLAEASSPSSWQSADGDRDRREPEEEHRSAFQRYRPSSPTSPEPTRANIRQAVPGENLPGFFAVGEVVPKQKQKSPPPPAFTCQVCGRMFRQDRQLENHMRIHTNERPYKCLTCNKCFRQEAHLTTHVRVHTGELPYQCEVCDRRFSQSSHLYRHRRTHSGDRPHACPHCPLRFILPNELRRHLPVHTGERRFSCYECGKAFKRAGHVDIHIRSVHLQLRPYECLVCGKAWAQKQHLHVHMRIHTGERPYWCDKCERSFSSRSYSRKHVCPGRPVTAAEVIEIAKEKRMQRVLEKKQGKNQLEENHSRKKSAKVKRKGKEESESEAELVEAQHLELTPKKRRRKDDKGGEPLMKRPIMEPVFAEAESNGCENKSEEDNEEGEEENDCLAEVEEERENTFTEFQQSESDYEEDGEVAMGSTSGDGTIGNSDSGCAFPRGLTDKQLAEWYQSRLNAYSSDSDEAGMAVDSDDPDWHP